jgi:hypothetical protein
MTVANLPRWFIGIGSGVSLTSLMLFAILSLAQRVEERPAFCPTVSCFIFPYHFHILGFDVALGTYQLLLNLLPVFAVSGAPLILAGLMLRGGKKDQPISNSPRKKGHSRTEADSASLLRRASVRSSGDVLVCE